MLIIPLRPIPSQVVALTLATQPCKISVYQKRTGLYADLFVSDAPIFTGVIAQDANRLVRGAYLGFVGDLAFFDMLGSEDPDYTGVGSRFILAYLEPSDLVSLGLAT